MWVHVYVNSSRDLPSIKAAVEDHGCEVAGLEPGLYEVRVHDPNGDAEDEVTEYLNDAGIEAEVSYENPQTEGKPKAYDLLISGNLLSVVVNGKSGTIEPACRAKPALPAVKPTAATSATVRRERTTTATRQNRTPSTGRGTTQCWMRWRASSWLMPAPASRWMTRSTLRASKRPWKLRGMLSARTKIHRGHHHGPDHS